MLKELHSSVLRLIGLMGLSRSRVFRVILACLIVTFSLLLLSLVADFHRAPSKLGPISTSELKVQYLDRNGLALSSTYQNAWNIHDQVRLHDIPLFLQQAFIYAEDQRFYQHPGFDVRAIASAILENASEGHFVRGASTITEQVARMLNPRKRTLRSRLLELFEAISLTRNFSKAEILEFYLNQVPCGGNRRGVAAAAKYFFDRSLSTLSQKEMLALAVMVRHPNFLRPSNDSPEAAAARDQRIAALAKKLEAQEIINPNSMDALLKDELNVQGWSLAVNANHFLRYINSQKNRQIANSNGRVRTTLDAPLQIKVTDLLQTRLNQLKNQHVTNGAILIVENDSNQILAWANSSIAAGNSHQALDAVLSPRQPGSTLKPFLYALSLGHGWNAATLIDDLPLAEPVGVGLKEYRNYSGKNYGPVRLRDALGNSLNIPAIRTVQVFGRRELFNSLHNFGFSSLTQPPDYYGDGLALGNGEVTLYELVRAYSVLANGGVYRDLESLIEPVSKNTFPSRIVSEEVASIISNILADDRARNKEFPGGLLAFPVQTAVKTGTSTDYHDAWALGYSAHYVVGVWLGNLNRDPMIELSGARGAVLLLRSVFAELERLREPEALRLSKNLELHEICPHSGKLPSDNCPRIKEWFIPGTAPTELCSEHGENNSKSELPLSSPLQAVTIKLPSNGLRLAMDPRIPDSLEAFPFLLEGGESIYRAKWYVDDELVSTSESKNARYLWPVSKGNHSVKALIWTSPEEAPYWVSPVRFSVH